MKSIILIGYMCAGKTTVGKALANSMNREFYDLDWFIESRFHKRISELFEERGENGFRQIESSMLHEAAEFEDIILACGGGTPCFFDNMAYMNQIGTTVFLKASPETIIEHLKLSHTVRPLLQDKRGEELKRFIEAQLVEREKYYAQAQYTFSVDILDDYDKIERLNNQILEVLYSAGK
jgi:shikimate kinase